MRTLVIFALSALVSVAVAKPTVLGLPALTYATLVPGAPVGADGRVVDTPEVTVAKNQHATAHLNERVNLVNEAARSGELVVANSLAPQAVGQLLVSQTGGLTRVLTSEDLATGSLALGGPLTLTSLVAGTPGASVGLDGRVVDTPAVAIARAEHAAAHLNAQLNLANEAARNSGLITLSASPALALRL